jgi:hypothetical protein
MASPYNSSHVPGPDRNFDTHSADSMLSLNRLDCDPQMMRGVLSDACHFAANAVAFWCMFRKDSQP